uniref:Transmembrane protein n=1 Tax=Steinernema glaseri TaxID=37863 RepID=A0A1I7XZE4_9BILA
MGAAVAAAGGAAVAAISINASHRGTVSSDPPEISVIDLCTVLLAVLALFIACLCIVKAQENRKIAKKQNQRGWSRLKPGYDVIVANKAPAAHVYGVLPHVLVTMLQAILNLSEYGDIKWT